MNMNVVMHTRSIHDTLRKPSGATNQSTCKAFALGCNLRRSTNDAAQCGSAALDAEGCILRGVVCTHTLNDLLVMLFMSLVVFAFAFAFLRWAFRALVVVAGGLYVSPPVL
mgnify:CR=1 FL=1